MISARVLAACGLLLTGCSGFADVTFLVGITVFLISLSNIITLIDIYPYVSGSNK